MVSKRNESESVDQRLTGNVMLGKKAVLKQFENITVSLMVEFYLDESDHIKEAQKLMASIDSITRTAKSKWGYP